jgi:hypothetical protein
LRDALFDEDPALRDQAAIVLGRAGDDIATPFLVEALGRNDHKIREQATKILGNLRDPSAVDPLLDALKNYRLRYLTVLALGKIGDLKAYDAIMDRLENDPHTDVRGYCVVALGWMGATAAVPRLLRLLKEEPEIKWTPETLVRLGAVGKAPLFGTDVAKGLPALKNGWGQCVEKQKVLQTEYLDRTSCQSTGPRADLAFKAEISEGALVVLRARHLLKGANLTVPLEVHINGRKVHVVEITPDFTEFRLPTDKSVFRDRQGNHSVTLKMNKNGKFEVDHVLVLSVDEAF